MAQRLHMNVTLTSWTTTLNWNPEYSVASAAAAGTHLVYILPSALNPPVRCVIYPNTPVAYWISVTQLFTIISCECPCYHLIFRIMCTENELAKQLNYNIFRNTHEQQITDMTLFMHITMCTVKTPCQSPPPQRNSGFQNDDNLKPSSLTPDNWKRTLNDGSLKRTVNGGYCIWIIVLSYSSNHCAKGPCLPHNQLLAAWP